MTFADTRCGNQVCFFELLTGVSVFTAQTRRSSNQPVSHLTHPLLTPNVSLRTAASLVAGGSESSQAPSLSIDHIDQLEPIPAVITRRWGDVLDELPVHCNATKRHTKIHTHRHTAMDNLESLRFTSRVFLNCGKKVGNLRRHKDTMQTRNMNTDIFSQRGRVALRSTAPTGKMTILLFVIR